MENTIAVVEDPLFAEHRGAAGHPERPERLGAARAALDTARLTLQKTSLAPRDATEDELGRVHGTAYLETLARAAGKSGYFDADTYFGPQSVAAARRAAGGVVGMTEALFGKTASCGVALVRPPGHHARPDAAMGFCLLNNVAVGAAHALALGAERVAIVDWDVHHGNGTQEIFFDDPRVLYVSLHQYPFYPGTGAVDEVGNGDGAGFTVNVPLSGGAGDAVYLAAVRRLIAPILSEYDPDLLLVSAGFDAHLRDPLASMHLTGEAYGTMLTELARALPRGSAGRVGLVLEGGYDLVGLEASLKSALEALPCPPGGGGGAGASTAVRPPHAPPPPPSTASDAVHEFELQRAMRAQEPFWRLD